MVQYSNTPLFARNTQNTKRVASTAARSISTPIAQPAKAQNDMNIFDEHRLALAGAAMCGDLLKDAEARLEIVQTARLEWAIVCPCSCAACDKFYETVRDALDMGFPAIKE